MFFIVEAKRPHELKMEGNEEEVVREDGCQGQTRDSDYRSCPRDMNLSHEILKMAEHGHHQSYSIFLL